MSHEKLIYYYCVKLMSRHFQLRISFFSWVKKVLYSALHFSVFLMLYFLYFGKKKRLMKEVHYDTTYYSFLYSRKKIDSQTSFFVDTSLTSNFGNIHFSFQFLIYTLLPSSFEIITYISSNFEYIH